LLGQGVPLPPLSMGEHSGSHGSAAAPTNLNAHQQLPALAYGGDVLAGHDYIVGDAGIPEVFSPSQNGTVYPSVPAYQAAVGGGWADTPVVHVYIGGERIDERIDVRVEMAQQRAGQMALSGPR